MKRLITTSLMALALAAPSLVQSAPQLPPDSALEHSANAKARGGDKVFYDASQFDLSGLPHYQPSTQVSGTLRIWGNNYLGDSPLGQMWKEAFEKAQPGVKIEYNLPSAAIAAPAVYFDLADIGINHEFTFYDHLAFARIKGFTPLGISAFTGSFNLPGWQNTMVIAVNKSNPISSLTMDQLDGIYGSVRDGGWVGVSWHPEFARGAEKDIRKWGQLGAKGAMAAHAIHPYGYTPRYATSLEFSNKVLYGSDKWSGDLRAYGNWRRPDNTVYGQASQIIDHLKSDPDGIAIIRYTDEVGKLFKVLPLAPRGGGAAVPYTLQSVQNRTYPLWGDQSLFVGTKPGDKVEAKAREFIRFVLSREGQELVAKDGKYMPLTAKAVAEEWAKLEAREAGKSGKAEAE